MGEGSDHNGSARPQLMLTRSNKADSRRQKMCGIPVLVRSDVNLGQVLPSYCVAAFYQERPTSPSEFATYDHAGYNVKSVRVVDDLWEDST